MAGIKVRNIDILDITDFMSTLIRKAFGYIPEIENTQFLQDEGIISKKERNFLAYTLEIPMTLLVKMVLVAFNIFPYPTKIMNTYGIQFKEYGDRVDSYAWAWKAALDMELIPSDSHPNVPSTKPQAMAILRKLENGNYKKLPKPNYRGIDLIPEDTTRCNWEWRNGIILGLQEIPETYLEMFRDKGWRFTYDKFTVKEDYSSYSTGHYVGLCSHTRKRIHINDSNPSTTVHELGHFIVRAMDVFDEQQELFDEEGEAAFPYLRSYAKTNASEYFAVFWETWISNWSKRVSLREAAPKTTEFITALLAF